MENKTTEDKIKRERSVSYPNFSLSDSVDSISKLRQNRGKGPYSRHEVAIGLGYSGLSGPSATKISTLLQFGLLTKEGPNVYSQTQLVEHITHPISDDDRNKAIFESLYLPKLYKSLIDDYTGQGLPTQLGNILIRKGISPKASERVAENFRKDLEFAGLLKNGVLLSQPSIVGKEPNQTESTIDNFSVPDTIVNRNKQIYVFNDSGEGWSLSLKSEKPLTAETKRKLIDIAEILEKKEE